MLHQEIPPIESSPLDGWERWLPPALAIAAGISVAAIVLLFAQTLMAAIALVAGILLALILSRRASAPEAGEPLLISGPDYSLVGAALGLSDDPVALTDGDGALLVVNASYRERFGGTTPLQLASSDEALE